MKEIPLSKGRVTIVDDEDFELLSQHKWFARLCNGRWYASRQTQFQYKRTNIYVHRLIMKAGPGQTIDHKNGNGLDNRKENLRFCTQSQNNVNRNQTPGKSGFRGVVWHGPSEKWVARISVNNRQVHLGKHADKTEAAKLYNIGAKRLYGEFAHMNPV